MPENPLLLDEVNANNLWFAARKTRSIWAKPVAAATEVLTIEGPSRAEAGDCLCRGDAGDVWPQSPVTLHAKYTATGEFDGDGWQRYDPRPDASCVYAARVPHEFQITSRWGKLVGRAGDYLVKHREDGETEYPDDVWIVSRRLFEATYERTQD